MLSGSAIHSFIRLFCRLNEVYIPFRRHWLADLDFCSWYLELCSLLTSIEHTNERMNWKSLPAFNFLSAVDPSEDIKYHFKLQMAVTVMVTVIITIQTVTAAIGVHMNSLCTSSAVCSISMHSALVTGPPGQLSTSDNRSSAETMEKPDQIPLETNCITTKATRKCTFKTQSLSWCQNRWHRPRVYVLLRRYCR